MKPKVVSLEQMISSFLVSFIHSCDASILQQTSLKFFRRYGVKTLATVHDSFGSDYESSIELNDSVKESYYDLGLDDNEEIITRCILRPNLCR